MKTFVVVAAQTTYTYFKVKAVDKRDAYNRVDTFREDPKDPRLTVGGGAVEVLETRKGNPFTEVVDLQEKEKGKS